MKKMIYLFAAVIAIMTTAPVYARQEKINYQIDANYPPFQYYQDNSVYGFDTEFFRLVFSDLNYSVSYSTDSWDKVYERIKKGEIDSCGLLAVTGERKNDILFTKPVITAYVSIYTKRSFGKIQLKDLHLYRVAVGKDYYTEGILRDTLGIKNYRAFEKIEDAIDELEKGNVDAIFENQEVINYLLIKKGLRETIIPQITNQYPMDIAYGIGKNRPELVDYMNRRIEQLQKSGVYEELYQKYFFHHSDFYMKNLYSRTILIVTMIGISTGAIFVFLRVSIQRLRKRVHEKEIYLQSILDNSSMLVMVSDLKGVVVEMNKYAEKITGYKSNETIGKRWMDIFYSEKDKKEVFKEFESFIGKNETFNSEHQLICKNGRILIICWSNSILYDKQGLPSLVVSLGLDITQRKEYEEKIYRQARYDSLTGLANRLTFEEYLNTALKENSSKNQKGAILFLDLDNFKTVNDSFGHEFGDTLLKNVGACIAPLLNEKELLCRFGGDEFAIILPQVHSAAYAESIAESIVKSFQKPWLIDEREFYTTTSIGITIFPDHGQDCQGLLKNADMAMYYAKKSGKNSYSTYAGNMSSEIEDRLFMESSLRRAMEREEFDVFYQPQLDLKTGLITGTEALIRWNHPMIGSISPARFIPIAEELGLIVPIGEWVLKTACKQNKIWNDLGYGPLTISVNLSVRQFRDPGLITLIQNVLDEAGLEPKYLDLEITESVAMYDIDAVIRTLNEIRKIGVEVALDDFGTGYSSLNYLKELPISIVKIDKSFVSGVISNPDEEAIAEAIITLAHRLNLRITAEGVESIKQFEFLRSHHCDKGQGYLFSKPLPAKDVEELFEKNLLAARKLDK